MREARIAAALPPARRQQMQQIDLVPTDGLRFQMVVKLPADGPDPQLVAIGHELTPSRSGLQAIPRQSIHPLLHHPEVGPHPLLAIDGLRTRFFTLGPALLR